MRGRWAEDEGGLLAALLASAAKGFYGGGQGKAGKAAGREASWAHAPVPESLPPWREQRAKGVGKNGKGPRDGKGKGFGRQEWECTICGTRNYLQKTCCRMCTHERAHAAKIVPASFANGKGGASGVDGAKGRSSGGKGAEEEERTVQPGAKAEERTGKGTPEARFSCRKQRKAATLLQNAGLVDEQTAQKIHAVAGADSQPAPKRSAPVGARLDRARARTEGIQRKVAAAEKAVTAAKGTLADAREELRAHEHMVVELEREIARGEVEQAPTRAEQLVADMTKLLAEEPDQVKWAFQARVMLQEANTRHKRESSDYDEDGEDGDEEEAEMGSAREEPAEDSEAGGWRRQGRGRFGKGNKRFKGSDDERHKEGKGAADGRERSPRRAEV